MLLHLNSHAERILNGRRGLVLDLDFTLLHLEGVPDAIEVPGRTRSAFIAPATVEALGALTSRFALILATARSWDGTRWVSEGLRARGVAISAAIIEDGALLHIPTQTQDSPQVRGQVLGGTPPDAWPLQERDWAAMRSEIEAQRTPSWPGFEWQRDFSCCLVARAESREEAAVLMDVWTPWVHEANARGQEIRLFRDGRKLYAIGRRVDKWAALEHLLGARASECAGVGDGANDLCWLPRVAVPCTLPHAAPQVLEAVRSRGGFVSPHDGHAGIVDVLRFLGGAPVSDTLAAP